MLSWSKWDLLLSKYANAFTLQNDSVRSSCDLPPGTWLHATIHVSNRGQTQSHWWLINFTRVGIYVKKIHPVASSTWFASSRVLGMSDSHLTNSSLAVHFLLQEWLKTKSETQSILGTFSLAWKLKTRTWILFLHVSFRHIYASHLSNGPWRCLYCKKEQLESSGMQYELNESKHIWIFLNLECNLNSPHLSVAKRNWAAVHTGWWALNCRLIATLKVHGSSRLFQAILQANPQNANAGHLTCSHWCTKLSILPWISVNPWKQTSPTEAVFAELVYLIQTVSIGSIRLSMPIFAIQGGSLSYIIIPVHSLHPFHLSSTFLSP